MTTRYLCRACGNKTRFDVTATSRTRASYHFTLGGELTTENETVLARKVEEVSCRWCNNSKSVETIEATEEEVPAG